MGDHVDTEGIAPLRDFVELCVPQSSTSAVSSSMLLSAGSE